MRGVWLLVFLLGCEWNVVDATHRQQSASTNAEPPPSTTVTASCEARIDVEKELLVTNRTVLLDPRARDGVWSFGSLVRTNPFPYSFRLIAIVNRVDLGSYCGDSQRELRFVYTATDTKGAALAFTTIIEVPYPSGTDWTARWHALGKLPFGATYTVALADLTTEVTTHASNVRVRTNEGILHDDGSWELRQYALQGGQLEPVLLDQTPRFDLARSASLDAWAKDNADAILDGTFRLPDGFQAETAPLPFSSFRWESSSMRSDVRAALSLATCNGCHGGERGGDGLRFQHLAPPGVAYYGISDGETQVSDFLKRELVKRAEKMTDALCDACTTPPPSTHSTPPTCAH